MTTDHSSLKRFINAKEATGRLARWSLLLQQYDLDVFHRPNEEHGNADSLSGRPDESSADLSSPRFGDPQMA